MMAPSPFWSAIAILVIIGSLFAIWKLSRDWQKANLPKVLILINSIIGLVVLLTIEIDNFIGFTFVFFIAIPVPLFLWQEQLKRSNTK